MLATLGLTYTGNLPGVPDVAARTATPRAAALAAATPTMASIIPTAASVAEAPQWTPLGYFEATNFGFDLGNESASVVTPGGLWKDPDNRTTMIVVVKPGWVLHLPGNQGWKADRWLMRGWDADALSKKPEETRKGSRLDFTPSLVIVDGPISLDQLVNYGPSEKRTLRSFGFEVKKHPAVP